MATPSVRDRAAAEDVIRRITCWPLMVDENRKALINQTAGILARHYSAPSPEPAQRPSEPGWYECRDSDESGSDRIVLWWDGKFLLNSPDNLDAWFVKGYTDFIGPLVLASRLNAGESLDVQITKYLTYTVKHDGWTLNVKASRGQIVVVHNPDGSVNIGNSGPVEDDEV